MDRRSFCRCCAGTLGLIPAAGAMAQAVPWGIDAGQAPAERLPRRTPRPEAPKSRFQGCRLTGGQSGGGDDPTSGMKFLQSCGIPYTDYAMHDELTNFMVPIYGVRPAFTFYDDSASPNAFADPRQLLGHGEGTVAYGVTLIQKVVSQFYGQSQTGGLQALGAIFAHEFGHLAQFRHDENGFQPGPHAELQADFVAGWYTGLRSLQQRGTVNFPEMAQEMFNIGDYAFTESDHHGTPEERQRAYVEGVRFSLSRNGQASVNEALDMFDRMNLG